MADTAERRPVGGVPSVESCQVDSTRIPNRAELSLQELAAQVAAQRARAQRSAKRTAMRQSGYRAEVAHVYMQLMDVEVMAHKPGTLRELADLCNMASRTFSRHVTSLENGGWVTRVRGGGRGNPTRFDTHIGKSLPPRPEPKSDAVRARDYRRRKAAASRESGTQTSRKTAHNVTKKRGTIRPERHGTLRDDFPGQPTFNALYRSDLHQEQVLTGPGPAQNSTTRAAENTPATTHPNLTAADPCPGQVQSSELGLTGSGTDKTLREQVWGGTDPAPVHVPVTTENRGRTVPKYMGDENVEVIQSWPPGTIGAWENRDQPWQAEPDPEHFSAEHDDADSPWSWFGVIGKVSGW